MLKRALFCTCMLIFFTLTGTLFSHSPLLLVEDNQDGTLYAEAGFSDGSGASGMECRLEDSQGNILWKGKFDDYSSVTVEIPEDFPYFVIFDGGPGHTVKKEGPALTIESESKETSANSAQVEPIRQQAAVSNSTGVSSPNPQTTGPIRQAPNQNYSVQQSGGAIPSWYTLKLLSEQDISSLKEELSSMRDWFPILCLSALFGSIALWVIAIALFRRNK